MNCLLSRYIFFNKMSLLTQNEASAMMSTTPSSDVGAIKMTDLRVLKINGDTWPYVENLDFSVRIQSPGEL